MEKPTYLLDIPAEEYHAATKENKYTTSHRLNLFRRCPALYIKHVRGDIVEGDTAAFMLGRATHTLVLEGATAFEAEYVVADGPENPKTGKPYGRDTLKFKEWAELQTQPVIGSDDHALMLKFADAVHSHPVAAELLSSGFAETTVRAEWDGEPVQARPDWFDPERGVLVDLKTCSDVDRFPFDIRDFGYVTQLAFYRRVLELAGYHGPRIRAYLIAVEKKEPYRVAVAEISELTLNDGNVAEAGKYGAGNDTVMRELLECRAADRWPTRYEELLHI
jgi:hypothetical protein